MPPIPPMSGRHHPSWAPRPPCTGGDHEASHGGGVLQGVAGNLGGSRIPIATMSPYSPLAVFVAVVASPLGNVAQDHGGLLTGVGDDLAQGLFHRAAGDADADVLVVVEPVIPLILVKARTRATPPPGTMPSSTAARVACRASSTRAFFSFISISVLAPTLMTATPPAKGSQVLLELLAVVVGGGLLDRARICSQRPLMSVLDPAPSMMVVVLADLDLLGIAEITQRRLLQGQADLLTDDGGTRQDSDVLKHGLAAVAKAGGLDRADLDDATQAVDHQGGQGLTLAVFADDQQRATGLGHALEHREQVADVA